MHLVLHYAKDTGAPMVMYQAEYELSFYTEHKCTYKETLVLDFY